MSASLTSPPPKTPARRHNPYATSASPCNTPLNSSHAASFMDQPSLSSSFANPGLNAGANGGPLDAADPTVAYRQQQQQQQQQQHQQTSSFGPNAAAAEPFSPSYASVGMGMPPNMQPPAPTGLYGDMMDPAVALAMYGAASAAANAAAYNGAPMPGAPYEPSQAGYYGKSAPVPGAQFAPVNQQQTSHNQSRSHGQSQSYHQQSNASSVALEPASAAAPYQPPQQQQASPYLPQPHVPTPSSAPAAQPAPQSAPQQQPQPAQQSGGKRRGHGSEAPCLEDLQVYTGALVEHARTASGSSFIQAAVKDSQDPRCLEFVWTELHPSLAELLLDAHGCYVVKTLLERLPPAEIAYVLQCIERDEDLGFSVCTHSLHTRRVVQHVIENINGAFLIDMMSRNCADIATTQQGCIVMQRAMDNTTDGPQRDKLIHAIAARLVNFAKDPFANYVVQHLMEVGPREATSTLMWGAFEGHVVELACNKFASNVIEKCLFHCTAEIQHLMLVEMYAIGPEMLNAMLQDSFGNYIIQSSIALATFRDVSLIDEKLRPVLAHTPYGHKIEGRLDRRLKGKPVPTRGAASPQGADDTPEGPRGIPPQRGSVTVGRRDGAGGSHSAGGPRGRNKGPMRKGQGDAQLPAGERAW